MSGIVGAGGMSRADLERELEGGARLVHFDTILSVCVISLTQPSALYLVRPGEGTFFKSLPATLATLLLGWWAFPFGPFLTVACLFSNLRGGNDVTAAFLRPPAEGDDAPSQFSWEEFKQGES